MDTIKYHSLIMTRPISEASENKMKTHIFRGGKPVFTQSISAKNQSKKSHHTYFVPCVHTEAVVGTSIIQVDKHTVTYDYL